MIPKTSDSVMDQRMMHIEEYEEMFHSARVWVIMYPCECLHATMRPADACEWDHRHRRLVLGVTERLASVILFTFTGEAPNQHQKLDHRSRQSDDRNRQLQDQDCRLHRQITSFRKRRRRRVAGLIPLTSSHSSLKRPKPKTNVLYFASDARADLPCAPGVSRVSAGATSYALMHQTNLITEYRKAA